MSVPCPTSGRPCECHRGSITHLHCEGIALAALAALAAERRARCDGPGDGRLP
jgi:hypothetical protein